jgi:hypothetical protein
MCRSGRVENAGLVRGAGRGLTVLGLGLGLALLVASLIRSYG